MATFTGMKISPVAKCVFSVPKRKCICWLCTPFFGMNTNSQKNPKISHDMTVDLPGIYFLSAPKETMIELVQVFLSQVDRRPR